MGQLRLNKSILGIFILRKTCAYCRVFFGSKLQIQFSKKHKADFITLADGYLTGHTKFQIGIDEAFRHTVLCVLQTGVVNGFTSEIVIAQHQERGFEFARHLERRSPSSAP